MTFNLSEIFSIIAVALLGIGFLWALIDLLVRIVRGDSLPNDKD